jgi:glycerol-3-phosphate dehydrogenase (NAD(P)+)
VLYNKAATMAVLGSGSWGTALALYLARRGHTVRLWSIVPAEIETMLAKKENTDFLPGFTLPDTIKPTTQIAEAVRQSQYIIMAVPSVGFRQTLELLKPHLAPTQGIVCATKGLDAKTGKLLHEVCHEVLGSHPFAALSGPSFAKEVARGLPAALVIASPDENFLQTLYQSMHSDIFHLYPCHDVIGVEIGGIVKNVIALAAGMVDGMELGANARSALITHGLNEMARLGKALGAEQDTFMGLSGLGDLILTCTDNLSRNRRLGLALGQGKDIKQAEQEIGQAVEGKENARLVMQLANQHQINLPLCETVWNILQGKERAEVIRQRL